MKLLLVITSILTVIVGYACCSDLPLSSDPMQPKIPIVCPMCEFATELVADTIFENENIKEFALNFTKKHSPCANMTAKLAQFACYTTLTATFNFFWQQVKNYWHKHKLCYQIKVCSHNTSSDMMFTPPELMLSDDKVQVPLLCPLCELATNMTATMIFDNKDIKNKVKEVLKNTCPKLPPESQTPCKLFVNLGGFNIFWAAAKNDMMNNKLCYQMKLCKKDSYVKLLATQFEENADNPCQVCNAMVSYLKPLVGLDKEAFDKKLCELCADMECRSFISLFGTKLFDFINSDMTAEEACKVAGYCM